MSFVTVLQSARALQNEINFFFVSVEYTLAVSMRFNGNFGETRDASQDSILGVSGAENWLVVTVCRGQVRLRLAQLGHGPMQPGGVDCPILGGEIGRKTGQNQQR